jgi:hypothetical protein
MQVLNAKNPIKRAREIMRNSFENDPDFQHVYEANIAMLLYDRHGGIFQDYATRNNTAKAILELLFWDKR